jgi:PEP-CTERM motif
MRRRLTSARRREGPERQGRFRAGAANGLFNPLVGLGLSRRRSPSLTPRKADRYSIIGSASHPTNSEDAWLVTRDPSVDAIFGDADGDGKIGLSDVFSSIVVSDGGKTITLSGGLIPRDGHFTDIFHASTTDGLPFFAAVDTSFGGVLVPEPSTWAMMVLGFAGLAFAGVRRAAKRGAALA